MAVKNSRDASGRRLIGRNGDADAHDSSVAIHRNQTSEDLTMAKALIAVVTTFLACHLPRIMLNGHELYLLGKMSECLKHIGVLFPIPFWVYAIKPISNVLLVLNSSINTIIFCWINPRVRQKTAELLRSIAARMCNWLCELNGDDEGYPLHLMEEDAPLITDTQDINRLRRISLPPEELNRLQSRERRNTM